MKEVMRKETENGDRMRKKNMKSQICHAFCVIRSILDEQQHHHHLLLHRSLTSTTKTQLSVQSKIIQKQESSDEYRPSSRFSSPLTRIDSFG